MGDIITFYSFKGGVGRTMALANIATLLTQWGYNVLIIDWDLHAPGLEYFFQDYIKFDVEEGIQKEGILDLIEDAFNGNFDSTKRPNLKKYLIEIELPNSEIPLSFITAGKRDKNYFKRVSDLDWEKFYKEKKGAIIIENLRNYCKEIYDIVLIDSRTGISDIGGICTIQFPDILVLLLTPTEQILKGTLEIIQKTASARQNLPFDRINLKFFPVPTRFDMEVRDSIPEFWLNRFIRKLSKIYDIWLPASINRDDFLKIIKIPYKANYSFGEKLSILDDTVDPGGPGYAYATLASLFAHGLNAADQVKENRDGYVKAASEKKRILSKTYDVFLSYNRKYTEAVEKIAIHLSKKANLRVWFDKWQLVPGEQWIRNLIRGLEVSKSCAIFIGKSDSPWQCAEVEAALKQQIKDSNFRVIPVLLPDSPESPKLPGFLTDKTCIRFREVSDG